MHMMILCEKEQRFREDLMSSSSTAAFNPFLELLLQLTAVLIIILLFPRFALVFYFSSLLLTQYFTGPQTKEKLAFEHKPIKDFYTKL